MLLLAKQSLDEAPYKLSRAVAKLASITFSHLSALLLIDKPWFLTEGKDLPLCSSYFLLGVSQLSGHNHHQLHAIHHEQEQQEHRFERVVFFQEREWNGRWKYKWRAKRAPHHATAWPGLDRATMWCGGMVGPPWGVPGASLPHFRHKNLKTIFWNFSRNFIFEDFQQLTND
jgi:hypothetical protein